MPRADTFMSSLFPVGATKSHIRSTALTPTQAASLSQGLRADGADFYYSGLVSFLDALNGINKGHCSIIIAVDGRRRAGKSGLPGHCPRKLNGARPFAKADGRKATGAFKTPLKRGFAGRRGPFERNNDATVSNKGFFTWAIVKLYYSVFYTFRSSLAYDGVCVFYIDRSCYIVTSRAGSSPVSSRHAGTHKTVLKTFHTQMPSHPLVSQQIDLEDAVDWLMQRREFANYGHSRFGEPGCGRELDYVASQGLRKAINAYILEPTFLYVFDPDHAMLAYPLRALQLVGGITVSTSPGNLTEQERQFVKARTKDDSGGLSNLLAEMKRLGILA